MMLEQLVGRLRTTSQKSNTPVVNRQQQLEKFYDEAFSNAERHLSARRTSFNRCYHICDTYVTAYYSNELSFKLLDVSICHLQKDLPKDIGMEQQLRLVVLDSLTDAMPLPTAPYPSHIDQGDVAELSSTRFCTQYLIHLGTLLLLDRERRRALLLTVDASRIAAAEQACIIRHLFSALLRTNDGLILHAAAVGFNGSAGIFVGQGGVGKSTTSLALLSAGATFLGDDYVAFADSKIHSLTNVVKLSDHSLELLSTIREIIPLGQRLPNGKYWLSLFPHVASQLVSSLPLTAVFVPQVSNGSRSVLKKISAGKALFTLAPSSIGQVFGSNATDMRLLKQLVESHPCYLLQLGSDIESTIAVVREVLSQ